MTLRLPMLPLAGRAAAALPFAAILACVSDDGGGTADAGDGAEAEAEAEGEGEGEGEDCDVPCGLQRECLDGVCSQDRASCRTDMYHIRCPIGELCNPDGDCSPAAGRYCEPCVAGSDCRDGDVCAPAVAGRDTFCLPRAGHGCHADMRAQPVTTTTGEEVLVCLPATNRSGCCLDGDEDGYGVGADCLGEDCNDGEFAVSPGAPEACNGGDDDCDREVDEQAACPAAGCEEQADGSFVATGGQECRAAACVPIRDQPARTECGQYGCDQEAAACRTACAESGHCAAAAHCRDGECVPDAADGEVCAEDGDCESGHCANGACCAEGDCCVEPDDCPDEYRAAAACDEPAACQGTRRDATCEEFACGSAVADDDRGCTEDTAANGCDLFADVACDGSEDQAAPTCADACAADSGCDPEAYCDDECLPDLAGGAACDRDAQCDGGHCGNGFCCAAGDCCAFPADCPAAYAAAASCEDAATCQGTRTDATCEASACGSVVIDDDSGCGPAVVADDCGLRADALCSGAADQTAPACAPGCFDDEGCDAGAHCDPGGNCGADHGDGGACDDDGDCQGGRCANGFCCASGDCCAAPADCPARYSVAPACDDDPTACQGTRTDATCTGFACGSQVVEDDSGCLGTVADDCGLFADQVCTADADQAAPGCPVPCASQAECDPAAHCEGGACAPDGVVINEVAPRSDPEWVELFNAHATDDIDLSGWTLGDTAGNVLALPDANLPPGGYLVAWSGGAPPDGEDADCSDGLCEFSLSPTLVWNNLGDDVILLDDAGAGVDFMAYGNGSGVPPAELAWDGPPNPVAPGIATDSVQRVPNGRDTDSVSDWQSPRAATGGGSND